MQSVVETSCFPRSSSPDTAETDRLQELCSSAACTQPHKLTITSKGESVQLSVVRLCKLKPAILKTKAHYTEITHSGLDL